MYGGSVTFKPGELIELAPGVMSAPWQPTARRVCLYLRREIRQQVNHRKHRRKRRDVVWHVILIDGQERLCDINVFNSANLL